MDSLRRRYSEPLGSNTGSSTDLESQEEKDDRYLSPRRAPMPPKDDEKDPNLVEFDGPDDPLNPMNMPVWRKWMYAGVLGGLALSVTFASSVFSTATNVTSEIYHVSTTVTSLGTGLFVLGFGFGPIIWGPMSELYGRKNPLLIGYAIFIIFQIPVAVAQNLHTILICRFLGGVFGAGPPSIIGGYLADIFPPVERGLAVAVFAATTLIGPTMGPIIGGFVTMSHLGWRWTAWITMLLAGLFGIIALCTLTETYAPVVLQREAKLRRWRTRNWALHSKMDEVPLDAHTLVTRYFARPFVMLCQEPILLLVTLYQSYVYGFVYLLFEAYPASFYEERGFNLGVAGLPFLAIGVGVMLGSAYVAYVTQTTIKRHFLAHGRLNPEDRLIPMVAGGILLPVGCFWFAWTSSPDISPWPQIMAGVPIGAGIQILFLQVLAYIIDVYTVNAASAVSASVIVRSVVGGAFPVAAVPMYRNMGVAWATSLLGFLAVAFFPVPILFYYYGARIRKLSKYAPTS